MRNTILVLLIVGSLELTARGDHGSSISLAVTVNQSQQYALPGLPTVVQSDLQNPQTHVPIPYTDGQSGVCASIASTGALTIDFDCQSTSSPRLLKFTNFPTSPLAPPSPPATSTCSASESTFVPPYTNRIGAGAASGGTPFQSMKMYPSETTTPYDVQVFIATQLPSTSGTTNAYRLDYQYNEESADGALASWAQVWRLSENEWIVESAPSSSTYLLNSPNAAMLVEQTTSKHMSTTAECGFYQVPFSLTLVAQ